MTPMLDRKVVAIDRESVAVETPGGTERIPARTVIWAAGVSASRLATRLGELTGAELDRAGRVAVEPDLTLPGHPEVFALGDMVQVRGADGTPVVFPGVAPVAMQQGRYAAKVVRARLEDGASARSAITTRATWRPSAAHGRSRTSTDSGSAASLPGQPGWRSTSGT